MHGFAPKFLLYFSILYSRDLVVPHGRRRWKVQGARPEVAGSGPRPPAPAIFQPPIEKKINAAPSFGVTVIGNVSAAPDGLGRARQDGAAFPSRFVHCCTRGKGHPKSDIHSIHSLGPHCQTI